MKITKVTVRGEAGGFAEITVRDQPGGDRVVEVEVIEPRGEVVLRADAGDRHRLWALAESVQKRLDGYSGAGGDVRDYFELIERVAGC